MASDTADPLLADGDVWLASARRSQDRLAAQAARLNAADLAVPSYCRDWTVAQVFSHLGSQAEIMSGIVDAGLAGTEPPERDSFGPIWATWNARSPEEQAADCVEANERLLQRFEDLDDRQRRAFRVSMFGMELDLVGLLRLRLGEQAMHAWDIAVAFDPAARLDPHAVQLLVDGLPRVAARLGKPTEDPAIVSVTATNPDRSFLLYTDGVRLEPVSGGPEAAESGEPAVESTAGGHDGSIELTAEALLRLVYGRLDREHGGSGELRAEGIGLQELRAIFPGF